MVLAAQNRAEQDKYRRYDYGEYLGGLRPLFSESDFVAVNLETPVAPSFPYTSKAASFNSPPSLLTALADVGVDFVSTANNHCLDRGVDGLVETLGQIDKTGLGHDGTYVSESDSETICIRKICGLRVAIVCCTFGTNSQHNGVMLPSGEEWRIALTRTQMKKKNLGFNPDSAEVQYEYIADDVSTAAIGNQKNTACLEKILKKVREAKNLADFVVAILHVGGQYNPAPGAYAKYIVQELRTAGADLIIAGHPHTSLRSVWASDCFLTYSLGNLCFTPNVGYYAKNTLADYGIVLHAYVRSESRTIARMTFDVVKSCVQNDGCTQVLPVIELLRRGLCASERERLEMEVEAVVNRFRGTAGDVDIAREYEFSGESKLP